MKISKHPMTHRHNFKRTPYEKKSRTVTFPEVILQPVELLRPDPGRPGVRLQLPGRPGHPRTPKKPLATEKKYKKSAQNKRRSVTAWPGARSWTRAANVAANG